MVIHLKKRLIAITACIAIILSVTVAATQSAPEYINMPVILYHHLSNRQSDLGPYVISPKQFEADIDYILSKGYTPITTVQLEEYVTGNGKLPKKPIMITFDDGHESFYAYAFDILKKHKISAVLSVVGKYTDYYSENIDYNVNYSNVTWEQIAEMSSSGFVEIGNHTYDMHSLSPRKGCKKMQGESDADYRKTLKSDISKTQQKINKYTASNCKIFTYPFGAYSSQTTDVVGEMGFTITFGCHEKVNRITKSDLSCLKMIKRFNRPSGKTSYEFFKNILE